MKIIYLAPENFSLIKTLPLTSAPRVRTFNIYKSLQKYSEIYCICGDYLERKKSYSYFYRNLNIEDFNGIYIESCNWPLKNQDYRFIKLCSNNIPTTIFYRDIYWKYYDFIKPLTLIKILNNIRFRVDWFILKKYCNLFFVPTQSFAKKAKINNFVLLPPGGCTKKNKLSTDQINLIYSGNIKKGVSILYEMMKILDKRMLNLKLHIFTTDKVEKKHKNIIVHKEGFYNKINYIKFKSIGLIPLEENEYYSLSFPLKFMDYLSLGMPVISTNLKELNKIILTNELGFCVDHTALSLADAISKLIKNRNQFQLFSDNALNYVKNGNTWDDRAKTIINKLKSIQIAISK